ncbi:MAG: hypothetical protein LC778_00835 [Acidobacteria bacterium]|nr:hypothetical protein [Acidobacteriota bacterium]
MQFSSHSRARNLARRPRTQARLLSYDESLSQLILSARRRSHPLSSLTDDTGCTSVDRRNNITTAWVFSRYVRRVSGDQSGDGLLIHTLPTVCTVPVMLV